MIVYWISFLKSILCVTALMSLEFLWGKWKKTAIISWKETILNYSVFFINTLLFSVGFFNFGYKSYLYCQFHGIYVTSYLNDFFYWVSLFLLQDFLFYWQHRYLHLCRWGWASHIVHHSASFFNTTLLMRHNVTTIITFGWFFSLPLAFLGYSISDMLFLAGWGFVYQFFLHSPMIGKLGFLEIMLNTPSHHRVHHGSNSRYINKNFGSTLILWDKLFGTYTPEVETVNYGLTEKINTQSVLSLLFNEWMAMLKKVIKKRNPKYFFIT